LDFIQYDPFDLPGSYIQIAGQFQGGSGIPIFLFRIQEVYPQNAFIPRKRVTEKGCFARSPRPEKKEAVCFQWLDDSMDHTPRMYAIYGAYSFADSPILEIDEKPGGKLNEPSKTATKGGGGNAGKP
jgi:hypothetical protein